MWLALGRAFQPNFFKNGSEVFACVLTAFVGVSQFPSSLRSPYYIFQRVQIVDGYSFRFDIYPVT